MADFCITFVNTAAKKLFVEKATEAAPEKNEVLSDGTVIYPWGDRVASLEGDHYCCENYSGDPDDLDSDGGDYVILSGNNSAPGDWLEYLEELTGDTGAVFELENFDLDEVNRIEDGESWLVENEDDDDDDDE